MADEFDELEKKYGKKEQPTLPEDEFSHIVTRYSKPTPTLAESALDVAKQIPSGLVAGTEAVAAFPAQALGFLGRLAAPYVPQAIAPGGAMPKPLDVGGAKPGLEGYLPEPSTTAGRYARTTTEMIPGAVLGARATQFSVPAAAAVGGAAGLASEAAGQATEGTPAELPARVGAALLGGKVAGRVAEERVVRTAAERALDEVRAAGDRGFNEFRQAGFGFDPAAAPTYTRFLKQNLAADGMTTRTAEKTWQVLDEFERTPFTNPAQLQAAYKELGSVAKGATNPEERRAARIAQERLLGFAENPPPWVVTGGDPAAGIAILRRANANWAAAARAETLEQRVAAGELRAGANYSGLNLENELRRRVGSLGLPERMGGMRGATEAEREAFTRFGQGNFFTNTGRYLTNLAGGRGGMGAIAGAGLAGGTGAYYGLDPLTYGAMTIPLGVAAAKYGNLGALQRSREIELQLLSRAPYARQQGLIPGTRSGAPYSLAPAITLQNLGQRYTPEGYPYEAAGP